MGDVGIEADCHRIVEATVAHFGQLDILVNNAGLGASGPFEAVTDLSVFERVMKVNYLGSVWCTAYALPHLKRTRGRIVAISSLTGLTGVPKRTAYAATKHAMAGFFDSLRIELANTGVSVTVIYPGFVFSEINQHALSPDGTPFGEKAYRRKPGETMETDECCRQILRATAARDRDLVMTWRGVAAPRRASTMPRLPSLCARATVWEQSLERQTRLKRRRFALPDSAASQSATLPWQPTIAARNRLRRRPCSHLRCSET